MTTINISCGTWKDTYWLNCELPININIFFFQPVYITFMLLFLSLALLLLFLHQAPVKAVVQCNIPSMELSALQDLYDSTHGESWIWQSNAGRHWDFSDPNPNPCHPPWQGIVCSNQSHLSNSSTICHILSIQLEGYNLMGTIPASMGNLSGLATLQLNYNSLNGSIPKSLGSLTQLSVLELVVNELTGSLPINFGAATAVLSHIYLYANFFTGYLPPNFFNGNNSALTYIEINDNYFSGPMPELSLRNLIYIDISDNMISGSLSNTISNSKSLQLMYLYNNRLSGTLPAVLGDLNEFEQIEANYNQFTGKLPEKWSSNLININLGPNYFSGSVLDSFVNLTSLIVLVVMNNVLSGTLPLAFNEFQNMTDLVLQDNAFSGSVFLKGLPALQYLQLQVNHFSGSIGFSPSDIQSLQFVDFSNNEFTGTLPVSMFVKSVPLVSFAASANCFHGSIPSELCLMSGLIYLDLDGLSTASRCRVKIFSHIKSLKSFYLTETTNGGIPQCLFALPVLETLLLSGNSIKWKIPSDLNISNSLTQLSLSHNQITGFIPDRIQKRDWSLLDLSYNRLRGEVDSENGFSGNTSLILRVNRLSGVIPENIKDLHSINILSGNLFDCNFERTSLPSHDPSYQNYSCGSNSFDQSMVMWLSFSGAIFLALMIGWLCRSSDFKLFVWTRRLVTQWQCYYSYFKQLPEKHELVTFQKFLLDSNKSFLRSTAALTVIGLVLYGSMKQGYGTAEHQGAWTISAAFLSGVIPSIVLLIYFLILVVGVISRLHTTHSHLIHDNGILTFWKWVSLFILVIINCCIIIAVNGCYVAVVLTYNTKIALATQIGMSVFKLLWNDIVVRRSVLMLRLWHESDDEKLLRKTVFRKELIFTAFMVLFNSIIAPCLATAAVDSNCFHDAIVAPAAVTSNLPVVDETRDCEQEIRGNGTVIESCGNYTTSTQYLSVYYDPPFIYSYQCSSSILTNYASVYVYMFLMVAFVKPIAVCLSIRWYKLVERQSCLGILVRNVMYPLLKPLRVNKECSSYFDVDTFALRMLAKVAILLTFGIVFPPLAVVVCVAFFSESYLHLIIIGRFLVKIENDELRSKFTDTLGKTCIECSHLMLQPIIQLVLPLSAVFLSLFVFDSSGDAVGYKQALWSAILLALTPWLCTLAIFLLGKWKVRSVFEDSSVNDVELVKL